ncbi:MAG: ABC transporter substrate-binding protein [Promethearchaeota archaeon]
MEPLTKRILAIVVIAVVGVGIGLAVWIFVAPYQWSAKDCPGAPSDITEDQIIRIGVIGDTERLHGESALWAAQLAAYEINTAGGVVVNGKRYYYGITSENSDEANPVLDITKGVSAATRLINYKRVQFATGGFRTEAFLAYRDYFMDAKIPFINTGASTSTFCKSVLDNYDKYKYFFQNNPINSTALAIELIKLIISTAAVQTALSAGALNMTRFSFMRENLAWTAEFSDIMIEALTNNTSFNLTYTGINIAIPQDVSETEMASYWSQINDNHTQIVIPIISGEAGLIFTTSYYDAKPKCIPIGINVMSQDAEYWTLTGGKCEYGVTLEALLRTNKTSKTISMWDAYQARYGTSPIYTGTGSYDAIYLFHYAINASQSFNPDTIVTTLEGLNKTNPLEGASGFAAFDKSHCIIEGWPYGTALAVQWYNQTKRLVPGVGIYPSGFYSLAAGAPPFGELIGMEDLRLPDWGIWSS